MPKRVMRNTVVITDVPLGIKYLSVYEGEKDTSCLWLFTCPNLLSYAMTINKPLGPLLCRWRLAFDALRMRLLPRTCLILYEVAVIKQATVVLPVRANCYHHPPFVVKVRVEDELIVGTDRFNKSPLAA